MPVYLQRHFKYRYQHHNLFHILNIHQQTSSPIIRYDHSHYFFTMKTQKDNHDKFVFFASGFSFISSAVKINLLVNYDYHANTLPPMHIYACKDMYTT